MPTPVRTSRQIIDSPFLERVAQSSPVQSTFTSHLSPQLFFSAPRPKLSRSSLKRSLEALLEKEKSPIPTLQLSSPAPSVHSFTSEESTEDDHVEQTRKKQLLSTPQLSLSPTPFSKTLHKTNEPTPVDCQAAASVLFTPCSQLSFSQHSCSSQPSTPCERMTSCFSSPFSVSTSNSSLSSFSSRLRVFQSQSSIKEKHEGQQEQEFALSPSISSSLFSLSPSSSSSFSFSSSSSTSSFSNKDVSSPFPSTPIASTLFSPTSSLTNTCSPQPFSSHSNHTQRPKPLFAKSLSPSFSFSFSSPLPSVSSQQKSLLSFTQTKKECVAQPPTPAPSPSPSVSQSSTCPPTTSHRQPKLPSTFSASDGIPRITSTTLLKAMQGEYPGIDQVQVIDCRFPFEYRGGHIQHAKNVNQFEELDSLFLETIAPRAASLAIVFHCEFSSHRGPLMAQHLRRQDRSLNSLNYPALFYPEVYILEGGYEHFFENHKEVCTPQGYVRMDDKLYLEECKREHSNRKHSLMRSKSSSLKWQ